MEGVLVHFNGLPTLHLSLIDLAEKEEARSTVGDLLKQVLLRIMLLQGSGLFAVKKGLLSLLILIELDTCDGKFVSVSVLHTVLEDFISLVSLALTYIR